VLLSYNIVFTLPVLGLNRVEDELPNSLFFGAGLLKKMFVWAEYGCGRAVLLILFPCIFPVWQVRLFWRVENPCQSACNGLAAGRL